jgi:hypothetical protein
MRRTEDDGGYRQETRAMRRTIAVIALIAVHAGLLLTGALSDGTAEASSGSASIQPQPKYTAWNGNTMQIDVFAENVVTTTQCPLNPNDENSPTGPCGMGAFTFTLSWEQVRFAYVGIQGVGSAFFLATTGRPVFCQPPTFGIATLTYSCNSGGAIPLGPQGSGKLATITFDPNGAGPDTFTTLTVSNITFSDIAGNQFPATGGTSEVHFLPCFDVTGDNAVDLSDALAILGFFGQSSPPVATKYDTTEDGSIDLSDVLMALTEFGQQCVAI